MSKSQFSDSTDVGKPTIPRAMVHKKILDVAEGYPGASMSEIASKVSGANTGMVERVFGLYGDPASEDHPPTEEEDVGSNQPIESPPSVEIEPDDKKPRHSSKLNINPSQLTERRREILRVVYKNPQASQRDIAALFGKSQSSICQRINSIDGFEWSNRKEIIETMVENDILELNGQKTSEPSEQDQDLSHRFDELVMQVQALEDELDKQSAPSRPVFGDTALAAKIVHACMDSDQITEEDEIQILHEIIGLGVDSA